MGHLAIILMGESNEKLFRFFLIEVDDIYNGFNVERHLSTFCNMRYSVVLSDHDPVKDPLP